MRRSLRRFVHSAPGVIRGKLRSQFPDRCLLPDFVIVGAMKAGTTSLFDYLGQHPQIIVPLAKEIRYFDRNYGEGVQWYQQWFPHHFEAKVQQALLGRKVVTGEASPSYMFYPRAIERLADLLPNARLIALLRNPSMRALSHYYHNVRAGRESLSFREAVLSRRSRLDDERAHILKDPSYVSHEYIHFSYFERGLYFEQLKTIGGFFPEERILVVASEDMFRSTQKVFDTITDFLGLDRYALPDVSKRNAGVYKASTSNDHAFLDDLYRVHNEDLFGYIGHRFDWS